MHRQEKEPDEPHQPLTNESKYNLTQECDDEDSELGQTTITTYGSSNYHDYSLKDFADQGVASHTPYDQEPYLNTIAREINQLNHKELNQLCGFLNFLYKRCGVPAAAIDAAIKTIFSTASGNNIPICVLNLLMLWPKKQPAAIRPTLSAGLGLMFVGLLIGLVGLFNKNPGTTTHFVLTAWKGTNRGVNAFLFVLSALIGFYVAILEEMGYNSDYINGSSSTRYLIGAIIPSTFIGVVHALITTRNHFLAHQHQALIARGSENEKELLLQIIANPASRHTYWKRFKEFALVKYDPALPRSKKIVFHLIRALEHLSMIFVLGSQFHTITMNFEKAITHTVKPQPEYMILRYSGAILGASFLSLINYLFYNKTNRTTASLIQYLEGINIIFLTSFIWAGEDRKIPLEAAENSYLPVIGGIELGIAFLFGLGYLVNLLIRAFFCSPSPTATPINHDRAPLINGTDGFDSATYTFTTEAALLESENEEDEDDSLSQNNEVTVALRNGSSKKDEKNKKDKEVVKEEDEIDEEKPNLISSSKPSSLLHRLGQFARQWTSNTTHQPTDRIGSSSGPRPY